MFRYIALIWDPANAESAAASRQYCDRWRQTRGWDAALTRDGIHVYTTGTRDGANEAQCLYGGNGVVVGKVFRRGDAGRQASGGVSPSVQDDERILSTRGAALVRRYWGRYVAFMLTPSGSVDVLRNPSGALPCFRVAHRGVSLVFSWLEDALQMMGAEAPHQVNWSALTATLRLGAPSGRQTPLNDVHEVLAGERVELRSGQTMFLWRALDFARSSQQATFPDAAAVKDAARELADAVRTCARAWASCYDTVLLRLSGGVDSSILLSCLDPAHARAKVLALNYHSEGSDSDERDYARLMAERASRPLIERERATGFHIERALRAARMPAPAPYIGWMNSDTDAQLARDHGAQAMFSGTGGDFLFYEYPRWWPAADYLHDKGLDAGFLNAVMDAARVGRVSVWHAAGQAARETMWPDRRLRATGGFQGLLTPDADPPPQGAQDVVHPLFESLSDLPIGKYMQTLALLYPMGYYDPIGRERSPELVSPLLSQPVMELCLSLPTHVLIQGGRGRALARRAFADALPARIANRRSKGGMEEHIQAVLELNIDLVRSLLLDGELCRRGLLDRRRLEALLSGRPTGLWGSPTQIHALVAVEAWLTHWQC